MVERSGEALRLARVYEGRDADGRPLAGDRAAIVPWFQDDVLAYLEAAPVVLAARSFEVDEFAPQERDVPLNFRTDGVWIWSGAVPHYLRKHGLPPEGELVRHIMGRGCELGAVDEAAKESAVQIITGG
ncbi:hypothetical protein [Nocardia sp. NBC_01388]|uniref:hypothetical protein n=1 Tax=Nocardia sp. NBC_01388 TaxID=2903596 RepID=UPI0032556431